MRVETKILSPFIELMLLRGLSILSVLTAEILTVFGKNCSMLETTTTKSKMFQPSRK
jgi:hypothetical protein